MKMIAVTLTAALLSTLTPVVDSSKLHSAEQDAALDAEINSMAQQLTQELIANLTANLSAGDKLSPMEKVMDMLDDLRMKVVNEEKEAYILYSQYTALCDKKFQAQSFLIMGDEREMDELRATLNNELAIIARMTGEVAELTSRIAVKTRELKEARIQRKVDFELYTKEINELSEAIRMLKEAIRILESGKGASLLQTNSTMTVAQTLDSLVQASAISSANAQRLNALVQANEDTKDQDDDDDDYAEKLGAPSAAYKSQSGGVIDVLSNTLDKAEKQEDDTRKRETESSNNFALLEKSLTHDLTSDKDRLSEIRGESGDAVEGKEQAQGEMIAVKDMLSVTMKTRKMTDQECNESAIAFTAESKLREEEVVVLTKAIKAISDATGAVTSHQFNFSDKAAASSFLQQKSTQGSAASTEMDSYFRAVRLVRDMGNADNSNYLKILAMRMSNAVKHTSSGDPFAKVKDLIHSMIYKLEEEAAGEADEHAFCEENMAKAEKAVLDRQAEVMKVQARFDAAEAAWMKCKRELQEISKSTSLNTNIHQKETQIRSRESEIFAKQKAEAIAAIAGVQKAQEILREYYGDESRDTSETDASHTIINLLSIIETDLDKSLANLEASEEMAKKDYEKSEDEVVLAEAAYKKDRQHKEKELIALEAKMKEIEQDLESAKALLEEAYEYYDKIKERCHLASDQFEQRIDKMKKELAGLKDALKILRNEGAFVQDDTPRSLRGLSRH